MFWIIDDCSDQVSVWRKLINTKYHNGFNGGWRLMKDASRFSWKMFRAHFVLTPRSEKNTSS